MREYTVPDVRIDFDWLEAEIRSRLGRAQGEIFRRAREIFIDSKYQGELFLAGSVARHIALIKLHGVAFVQAHPESVFIDYQINKISTHTSLQTEDRDFLMLIVKHWIRLVMWISKEIIMQANG